MKRTGKISSFRVNTTSRLGIKQLGISFGSIFLLFSNKSSRGATLVVSGENPRSPALNDNPASFLPFYFRVRAFSLLQTRQSRSLEQAKFSSISRKGMWLSLSYACVVMTVVFNPLSPKSDQHQCSLCNINAL